MKEKRGFLAKVSDGEKASEIRILHVEIVYFLGKDRTFTRARLGYRIFSWEHSKGWFKAVVLANTLISNV